MAAFAVFGAIGRVALLRIGLMGRFAWVFFLSLFVPTATMNERVEALLAEWRGNPNPED